jgi:hypothetical protein
MRKSERLRLLEMHMVRLEMMVELYSQSLTNLLESQGLKGPTDLDAGKWYQAKINKTDTE